MEIWVDFSEILRNLALGIVAILGLLVAWRRMQAATRQADASLEQQRLANDALMQEIFSTAVENLSRESMTLRVGGILSLSGLAATDRSSRLIVFELLAAYIQERQTQSDQEELDLDIKHALQTIRLMREEP